MEFLYEFFVEGIIWFLRNGIFIIMCAMYLYKFYKLCKLLREKYLDSQAGTGADESSESPEDDSDEGTLEHIMQNMENHLKRIRRIIETGTLNVVISRRNHGENGALCETSVLTTDFHFDINSRSNTEVSGSANRPRHPNAARSYADNATAVENNAGPSTTKSNGGIFTFNADGELYIDEIIDETSGSETEEETSEGDEEASGGDEEASGGDEEASGGDEEASGGDEEASGGDEEASGGDEEASGGDEEGSGGDEEASGGDEEASGGDEKASGKDEGNSSGREAVKEKGISGAKTEERIHEAKADEHEGNFESKENKSTSRVYLKKVEGTSGVTTDEETYGVKTDQIAAGTEINAFEANMNELTSGIKKDEETAGAQTFGLTSGDNKVGVSSSGADKDGGSSGDENYGESSGDETVNGPFTAETYLMQFGGWRDFLPQTHREDTSDSEGSYEVPDLDEIDVFMTSRLCSRIIGPLTVEAYMMQFPGWYDDFYQTDDEDYLSETDESEDHTYIKEVSFGETVNRHKLVVEKEDRMGNTCNSGTLKCTTDETTENIVDGEKDSELILLAEKSINNPHSLRRYTETDLVCYSSSKYSNTSLIKQPFEESNVVLSTSQELSLKNSTIAGKTGNFIKSRDDDFNSDRFSDNQANNFECDRLKSSKGIDQPFSRVGSYEVTDNSQTLINPASTEIFLSRINHDLSSLFDRMTCRIEAMNERFHAIEESANSISISLDAHVLEVEEIEMTTATDNRHILTEPEAKRSVNLTVEHRQGSTDIINRHPHSDLSFNNASQSLDDGFTLFVPEESSGLELNRDTLNVGDSSNAIHAGDVFVSQDSEDWKQRRQSERTKIERSARQEATLETGPETGEKNLFSLDIVPVEFLYFCV